MRTRGFWAMLKNRKCRHEVYASPEYWNSRAEEFPGESMSMFINNHLNHVYRSEQLSVIQKYLPDVKGLDILDVGCGGGRIARHMVARGAHVYGVDFSKKSIEIAMQKSRDGNPSYRVQSIYDLNEQNAYHIVLAWGVFTVACHDRSDLFNAMKRLRAALRPGGRLLVCDPIHKGPYHRVLDMDVKEYTNVMEDAGFAIKDVTQIHFLPMRLLLSYIPWPKFITLCGYYIDRAIMKIMRHKKFGDYKVIYAVLRSQ